MKTDPELDYAGDSDSLKAEEELWRVIYQRPLPWRETSEVLIAAILRFSQYAERVRELFCRDRRMGVNELWTLYVLQIHERCPIGQREILSPGRLAEIVEMAPGSNPSAVVSRLYSDGYIDLQGSPKLGDRRKRALSLTTKGRAAAKALERDFLKLGRSLAGDIDEQELRSFLRVTRLILGRLINRYNTDHRQIPAGRRSSRLAASDSRARTSDP